MLRRCASSLAVALILTSAACDSSSSASSDDPVVRTVLVDYKHDEFASAFLRYYPEHITVRQGDRVRFKQAWTGEPHSVTFGRVVDDMFEYAPIFEQYESPEAAMAAGVAEATIEAANATFARTPSMVEDGFKVSQSGARPCFVENLDDVPRFNDGDSDIYEGVACPTDGQPQPAFNGRQGLYNSGFIAPTGEHANEFTVPIADDADPGSYRFFCNYHWTPMSGTLEVVTADKSIPSQDAVNRIAREEIDADADLVLDSVLAERRRHGTPAEPGTTAPAEVVAGLDPDEAFGVLVDEFFPTKVEARVGQPVTWSFQGIAHTVSFNVPKYFPIFKVDDDDNVAWNPESYEPVTFAVPPRAAEDDGNSFGEAPPSRDIDVGRWDGSDKFSSSGAIAPGDTFTLTPARPGSYPYACLLHPPMVGVLQVR